MFEPVRPTRRRIDSIMYNAKDPLWFMVRFMDDQVLSMLATKTVEPYKSNFISKLGLDNAIKNMANMRDYTILAHYN